MAPRYATVSATSIAFDRNCFHLRFTNIVHVRRLLCYRNTSPLYTFGVALRRFTRTHSVSLFTSKPSYGFIGRPVLSFRSQVPPFRINFRACTVRTTYPVQVISTSTCRRDGSTHYLYFVLALVAGPFPSHRRCRRRDRNRSRILQLLNRIQARRVVFLLLDVNVYVNDYKAEVRIFEMRIFRWPIVRSLVVFFS